MGQLNTQALSSWSMQEYHKLINHRQANHIKSIRLHPNCLSPNKLPLINQAFRNRASRFQKAKIYVNRMKISYKSIKNSSNLSIRVKSVRKVQNSLNYRNLHQWTYQKDKNQVLSRIKLRKTTKEVMLWVWIINLIQMVNEILKYTIKVHSWKMVNLDNIFLIQILCLKINRKRHNLIMILKKLLKQKLTNQVMLLKRGKFFLIVLFLNMISQTNR